MTLVAIVAASARRVIVGAEKTVKPLAARDEEGAALAAGASGAVGVLGAVAVKALPDLLIEQPAVDTYAVGLRRALTVHGAFVCEA